jgi:hypothetical protein
MTDFSREEIYGNLFHDGNLHTCGSDGAALAAEHRGAFFGKLKLALLVNYLFTLYWGYGINRDFLVGSGYQHLNGFTILYVGFGLIIAVVALVSLISEPTRK